MFVYQGFEEGLGNFSKLSKSKLVPVSWDKTVVKNSKFDLSVEMWPNEGGLSGKNKKKKSSNSIFVFYGSTEWRIGTWEYNADLFNESTIKRMLDSWIVLLQG